MYIQYVHTYKRANSTHKGANSTHKRANSIHKRANVAEKTLCTYISSSISKQLVVFFQPTYFKFYSHRLKESSKRPLLMLQIYSSRQGKINSAGGGGGTPMGIECKVVFSCGIIRMDSWLEKYNRV